MRHCWFLDFEEILLSLSSSSADLSRILDRPINNKALSLNGCIFWIIIVGS